MIIMFVPLIFLVWKGCWVWARSK